MHIAAYWISAAVLAPAASSVAVTAGMVMPRSCVMRALNSIWKLEVGALVSTASIAFLSMPQSSLADQPMQRILGGVAVLGEVDPHLALADAAEGLPLLPVAQLAALLVEVVAGLLHVLAGAEDGVARPDIGLAGIRLRRHSGRRL